MQLILLIFLFFAEAIYQSFRTAWFILIPGIVGLVYLFGPTWSFNMDFLFALFALGTFGFWGLWAAVILVMIWFTDNEWPGCAFTLTLGSIALLWFGFGISPLWYVLHEPWYAAAAFASYFAVGVGWMVLRWTFWVQSLMDFHKDNISNFKSMKSVTVPAGSPEWKSMLYDFLDSKTPGTWGGQFPPSPYKNKARLLFWIGYWPFSAVWTLINEPIKKISTFIYNRLTGLIGWITNKVIAANIKV